MVNKKTILKVFLVVLVVAILLISAIAVFKQTNEGNNKQVASTTLSLNDSQTTKDLNKSVTNNIKQTPTITFFEDFQDQIKTSNPVIYNKCRLTHLQHIIQSTLLKDLSVYSAFGSRDASLKAINQKLEDYAQKQEKTYEAVAIFNQDYVISTTSQNSKLGEMSRIADLLDEQNKLLFEANSMLLDYIVQYGFNNANVAKADFRIVLFDVLLKQSGVLQKQINELYAQNEVGENLECVFTDSTNLTKAYAVADKNSFVYNKIDAVINDVNLPSTEKFVTLFNTTSNVADMLKSESKTVYISLIENTELKQDLNDIWSFLVKLSAGGL